MRKQLVPTILLVVFLSTPGWVRRVEFWPRPAFFHFSTLQETIKCEFALPEHRGPTFPRRLEPRREEEPVEGYTSARLIVLDLLALSKEGQPFQDNPVWRMADGQAFLFVSGMTIDADGAPNAYHPNDSGLDDLANAGGPGNWNGIVTGEDDIPLLQQDTDPFTGYYISCTSLSDLTKDFSDPRRYVDASKIPYIALPQELADREGLRLGDLGLIVNLRNGDSSYAIYADIGTFGEGSIALADALGISSDARDGGQSDGILYLLFPGSGNQQPRTMGEIEAEGEKLISPWWRRQECSYTEKGCFAPDFAHAAKTRSHQSGLLNAVAP